MFALYLQLPLWCEGSSSQPCGSREEYYLGELPYLSRVDSFYYEVTFLFQDICASLLKFHLRNGPGKSFIGAISDFSGCNMDCYIGAYIFPHDILREQYLLEKPCKSDEGIFFHILSHVVCGFGKVRASICICGF